MNVNKIASSLEGHQVQLMKDIVMLDKLYETNLAYHKELPCTFWRAKSA